MSSAAALQKKSLADRTQSLHTVLQQETEKIRKWKIQTEVELKQKTAKLQEAHQTVAALRKSMLEMQLQNESIRGHLEEEIECRDNLNMRIDKTREMCGLLKNFSASVNDRINQCEAEKLEMERVKTEQCHHLEELTCRFHDLEIAAVQKRNELVSDLENERSRHAEHFQELSVAQKQLENLQGICAEKDSNIERLRMELQESFARLEALQTEHVDAVNKMESNLGMLQVEFDKVSHSLKEALEREKMMSDELDQLQQHMQQKRAEIAVQLELAGKLSTEKSNLESGLNTFKSLLEVTCTEKNSLDKDLAVCRTDLDNACRQLKLSVENAKMLTEEKNSLSEQVEQLKEQKAALEEEKAELEETTEKQASFNLEKIEQLTKESSEKSEEIQTIRQLLKTADEEQFRLTGDIELLQSTKNLIESELKNSQALAASTSREFDSLLKQYQHLEISSKDELQKVSANAEKEQVEKMKMQTELTQHLAVAKADIQKLQQDLTKKDQQLQMSKDAVAGHIQKEQYLMDEIKKLTDETSDVNEELAAVRNELKQTKSNNNELSEQLKKAELSATETVGDLNKKLKQEQIERNQLEENLKHQLSRLNKEVEELQMGSELLKQGKEAAEKQIKAMSGQLLASVENYKKGYEDIMERNKQEYDESRKKTDEELQSLRVQTVELKDQLDKAKSAKEAAELKVMTHSVHLNSLVENSKWELNTTVSRKEKELEEMQKRIDNLQETVQRRETELSKQESTSQMLLTQCRHDYEERITLKDSELEALKKKLNSYAQELNDLQRTAVWNTPLHPSDKSAVQTKLARAKLASKVQPKEFRTDWLTSEKTEPINCEQIDVMSRSPTKDELSTPMTAKPKSSSLLSTGRKRKGITTPLPELTEESSSDAVAFSTPAKNSSQEKASGRTTIQKKDGKIFFKASPRKQNGSRSKPAKETSVSWFDSDDVFGFGPED